MCEKNADLAHYNFAKVRFVYTFVPLKQNIMKLIGREIEQQKLTKYMQSERGEFIAI